MVYLALKHFLNFRFFVCRGRKSYAEKIRALPVHRDITGRLGLLTLSPQRAAVRQPFHDITRQLSGAGNPCR